MFLRSFMPQKRSPGFLRDKIQPSSLTQSILIYKYIFLIFFFFFNIVSCIIFSPAQSLIAPISLSRFMHSILGSCAPVLGRFCRIKITQSTAMGLFGFSALHSARFPELSVCLVCPGRSVFCRPFGKMEQKLQKTTTTTARYR